MPSGIDECSGLTSIVEQADYRPPSKATVIDGREGITKMLKVNNRTIAFDKSVTVVHVFRFSANRAVDRLTTPHE